MLMTGATSIRDVIAFPKTKTAECPLTQAPAPVEANQLRDLGIRLREQQKKEAYCFNKTPCNCRVFIRQYQTNIRFLYAILCEKARQWHNKLLSIKRSALWLCAQMYVDMLQS